MKISPTFKIRIKLPGDETGALITFKRERLNDAFLNDKRIQEIADDNARSLAKIERVLKNIVAVEGLECDGEQVTVEQLHGPVEKLPIYQDMLIAIFYGYNQARSEMTEKKATFSVEW